MFLAFNPAGILHPDDAAVVKVVDAVNEEFPPDPPQADCTCHS